MGLFDKLKQTVEDVPRAVPAASEQTTEVVFPKLPDTLEAFKALPQAQLSTPSDTAALTVLALCFYPENAELSLQMLGFLKGPQPLSAYEKQFIRDRFMGKDYVPRSYFTGAVPANDYTPAEPYTIKVSENPYSYSEQGYAKLYLQSGGADSPRAVQLRHAKDVCHLDTIRSLPDKANVTAIVFDHVSLKGDCTGLFSGYSSLQKIDLSNVDMSGVTSTSRMFENCSRLTEFTASFSNSGKYPVNLTDMSCMFSGCKKMTSCGMYNWDLRKVTTFEGMFDGCKLLKYYEPSIPGYTDSCTNVKYMFRNCSALTHLNLGSWNLQNVQLNNKADMFAGCSSLLWLTADSASGWYDASRNKLEKNAVFQMEGAYYLKLTLNPTIATGFREITPDVLKKIRIGFKSGNSYYDYDTKKQFVDVRAGNPNEEHHPVSG